MSKSKRATFQCSRVLGLAALRLIAVGLLSSGILWGCGGGGGDSAETQASTSSPFATASATTSVALGLASGPTVSAVTVQSLTDEQPIGAAISYPASEAKRPLFALNAASDIVLAARPSNGRANFTASSTVQILAGFVLSTYFSDFDTAVLESAATQAPSFASAVAVFEAALTQDVNPPTDPAFQAQFQAVVKEVLQLLPAATGPTQAQARAQPLALSALPPDRLDPAKKNPVGNMILLETLPPAFGSPLSISLENDPAVKGIGRFTAWNGTPVYWDVVLTDATGAVRSDSGMMKPASLLLGVLADGESLTLVNPGVGAFGMTISPSMEANSAKLFESAVKLFIGARPTTECSQAIAKFVIKVFVQAIKTREDPTPKNAFELAREYLKSSWADLREPCDNIKTGGVPGNQQAADRLFKTLNWVGKVLDATEIAVQLQVWLKYKDTPVSVGVCVNDSELVMSCVSSIAKAYDPPPIAAGLPDNYYWVGGGIKFYDRSGSPTTMPADLKEEYLPQSLRADVEFKRIAYDVSGGLTYVVKAITGTPAQGTIRLRDLATDVSVDIPVKVSNGRLGNGSPILVNEGQTIQLPLLEAEGTRPLYFASAYDVHLPTTNTATVDATWTKDGETGHGNHSVLVSISGKKAGEETKLQVRKNSTIAPYPNYLLAEADVSVKGTGMLGDVVTVSRRYPTVSTPYSAWRPSSASSTVIEGRADELEFNAGPSNLLFARVDAEASEIKFLLVEPSIYISSNSIFDGFVISGFSHLVRSVIIQSNQTGLAIAVDHTTTEVRLALSGRYGRNVAFTIHIGFSQ